LDGPPQVHNHHRKDNKGKNTFDLVFQNVGKLQKTGLLDSVLAVVTPETALSLLETYQFFKSHSIQTLEFTPV
jgi:uncharacterized protein